MCVLYQSIYLFASIYFTRRFRWLCVSLTFPLHYFSENQSSCHPQIWSAMIFSCFLFFLPTRFLKGPKRNLCRTPSVTLLYGSECLFTITFWNLSVSQLLIHLMLCLLYWFYIVWVSWSKYYVVLSQMPYRNLSILHYHYYLHESDL